MTEQKFEDLPIANKNKIVLIRQVDDKWRIGYVLDGKLYVHQLYHSGTFNSVRDKVKEYINDGCVIGDFKTNRRWTPVENIPELVKNMFSYVTTLQVTAQDIHQFEIIERIKAQEVSTREPDEIYGKPSPSHPVLSKSDDEIMSDIIAGIHLKPLVIEITEKEEVEEPPIMAAGALADAGLLKNQNIGLPSDLLRAANWPAYWKFIPSGWSAIDTYRIGVLFPVDDPSGRIIHARKKLLVPGVRTGGKSMYHDIKEARDTLTQWLEDNPE